MALAIITMYSSKLPQMDPRQLLKASKFYSRCNKCDIEKALGWVGTTPLVARRLRWAHWSDAEDSTGPRTIRRRRRINGHIKRETDRLTYSILLVLCLLVSVYSPPHVCICSSC